MLPFDVLHKTLKVLYVGFKCNCASLTRYFPHIYTFSNPLNRGLSSLSYRSSSAWRICGGEPVPICLDIKESF